MVEDADTERQKEVKFVDKTVTSEQSTKLASSKQKIVSMVEDAEKN